MTNEKIVKSGDLDVRVVGKTACENCEKTKNLFVKYGEHLFDCPKRIMATLECNCGFDEAIDNC